MRRPAASLSSLWWGAVGLAIALAAVVFFATLGPRPDLAAAAETPRFVVLLHFCFFRAGTP
ncbi:MAG: NrsF family protein [Geminicoccaceae bacterium]